MPAANQIIKDKGKEGGRGAVVLFRQAFEKHSLWGLSFNCERGLWCIFIILILHRRPNARCGMGWDGMDGIGVGVGVGVEKVDESAG